MNPTKQRLLKCMAAIVAVATLSISNQSDAQQAEMEVLTRGPVHEAFAGTVSYNPEPGIIINTQVPGPIEEMPPEQQLDGENVAWIPGYWAWDEEQNDFLWISGIWRNLPPGRQWVPGYWADVDGGYQWTSGYWEDAGTTEVTYLPEPPRSVEVGPNITAPSASHTWIPGNWMWTDSRYAWRAGYWTPARESWIWMPGYHRWTRRGFVYVNGYWDYAVDRRGVLFAPVHFRRPVYANPGYFYSPTTVISLLAFTNHLFLRPSYCHYYFGDYYAPIYRSRGFHVSYSYHSGRRGYDPIYSHYRWKNRNVPNWEKQRRDYYEYRRDHENARPPRTWAALNSLPGDRRRAADYAVAEPLSTYAVKRDDNNKGRFKNVSSNDRQRIATQSREVRKYASERKQLESRRESVAAPRSGPVTRTKVSRSPVVATVNDRSDKAVAPPERLEKHSSGKIRESANVVPPGKQSRPTRETEVTPADKATKPSEPGKSARADRKPEPSTQKTTPEKKRQAVTPPVDRKPAETNKSVPRPTGQAKPEAKRQSVPSPTRQVEPAPTERAAPQPSRKAVPVQPERQQIQPAKQKQAPKPERTAPQPSRKAVPVQPERQQIQPPKQKQAPKPERTAPQQRRSDSSSRSSGSKDDDSERGRGKR